MRICIAVSACLLGEEVRYDGGHRRHGYVANALGEAFTLVPECPEVGIGLGTPRPKIRLENRAGGIRLTGADGGDLTPTMRRYADAAAERFAADGVAGVVLKSRSPSCGLGDAKVFRGGTLVSRDGAGVFAARLAEALPGAPQISEAGLDDPALRDHWLTRVFAFAELGGLGPAPPLSRLHGFHARWKMALMAHSEAAARRLGRGLAAARDPEPAHRAYRRGFLAGLAAPPSPGTHQNALQHLAGRLDPDRRAAAHREIAAFDAQRVPLAVPVRAIREHGRRLGSAGLAADAYLAERPAALGYRERIYGAETRR